MRLLAAALLAGATIATPAMAAPIIYDFTATFMRGPNASLSGSYAVDGQQLTAFDLVINGFRHDLSNVGVRVSGAGFLFGGLENGVGGLAAFTNDFSFGTTSGVLNYATPGTAIFEGRLSIKERVAAVPEPATWAMMIGGFGLVGGAMRRRQRTVVTYA